MKEGIFKLYDIRGKYPGEIGEREAAAVAAGFVDFLKKEKKGKKLKVVLSIDASKGAKDLVGVVKGELIEAGMEIIYTGMVTTPAHVFTVINAEAPGIMMTASHLADKQIGFKFAGANGEPIMSGSLTPFIKKREVGDDFKAKRVEGDLNGDNFLRRYIQMVVSHFTARRSFKVVADASGGAVSKILPMLAKEMPRVKFKKINFKKTTHGADPTLSANQKDIKKELRQGKFDLGVLFDGDADRVVFFDDKGGLIDAGIVAVFLSSRIASSPVVVGNISLSHVARDEVRKMGGKFIECRTGHVFIKQLMRIYGADIGAESSGHFYFKEMGGTESALLTMVLVMSLIDERGKQLSVLRKELPNYWRKEDKFVLKGGKEKFESLVKKIKNDFKEARRISEKDGIKVEMKDWWFLVRKSETEPVVRILVEAENAETGEKGFKRLKIINSAGRQGKQVKL